jgi:predicted acyltransferase
MDSLIPQKRLLSLDAFRGVTIALMVLVNDNGGDTTYAQLLHAHWHGWTMTDMIFPFFLWIVGVAMTFSFAKRIEQGEDKKKLVLHALQRSVILFIFGLIVNNFPFGLIGSGQFFWATWRIPGVLQRIAICYFIATIIYLYSSWRGQVAWIFGLLTSYWLLVKLVPVPGYGAGVLELFGILTGTWLRRADRTKEEKTCWMFVVGIVLVLIGTILNMWLPINKNMWTSSYTVFMAGWALVSLGVFYFLIDVKGYSQWAKPFIIFGLNAIALYMFSELLASLLWVIPATAPDGSAFSLHEYIYQSWFLPWASPVNASLSFAIAFVLLTYLVAWVLWRRKWFFKI